MKFLLLKYVSMCRSDYVKIVISQLGILFCFCDRYYWRDRSLLWYKSSPQHILEQDFKRLFPDNTFFDYNFAVVRDPVSRFISAFNFNRHRLRHYFSPGQFLMSFYKNPEKLMNKYDNHFVPASELLSSDTKIFRLEDGLSNVEEFLNKELDRKICIAHENKAKHITENTVRNTISRKIFPKIEQKDEFRHKYGTIIREIYANDYTLLGYE